MSASLPFSRLAGRLAVCRLAHESQVPGWAWSSPFCAVVRTPAELSIVCAEISVPDGVTAEKGFRALGLEGPFPFSMTGVLASFASPLAAAGIPIFALSTYDTDWILIKESDVERACAALREAGHREIARAP